MKALAERKPVIFGIVSAVALFVLYALVSMGLYGLVAPLSGTTPGYLFGGAIRVVFAVLAIILLGFIIKDSGFRFTFSTHGLAKSMFAGIPLLLYLLTLVISFFTVSKINTAFIPLIPAYIFQQITVGIFEESLFRGLLMTALIVKFCGKAKGRFLTVYLCGLLFGLVHFVNAFASSRAGYGNVSTALSTALVLALPGIAFAVVYLYSKNVLGCIILHALYDIVSGMYSGLIAEVGNKAVFQSMQSVSSLLLLAMPLLVIPWIIKARSFEGGFQQISN